MKELTRQRAPGRSMNGEKRGAAPRFTEEDTERFYNLEDALYRSFWDEAGSLHWGVFDEETGREFLKGSANLDRIMADKAEIGPDSHVLDLGCGNGNTSIWIGQNHQCQVTGIDLSGVHIANARAAMESHPDDIRQRVEFERGSATNLPFNDGTFTHVLSQSAIYHVPDKTKALREANRVLVEGGMFVLDDLIKPKPHISDAARKYVYDRLLFDTDFSFNSYQTALKRAGFQVREAQDLSEHLKTSYQILAGLTRQKIRQGENRFEELSLAYDQMVRAIENKELGWALYVSTISSV